MSNASSDDDLYHLNKSILTHMGLVVAYWGVLEAQIEFFILRNQNIPSGVGLVLTTNLSYRQKADLLLTFASDDAALPECEKNELKKIAVEADRLYGRRNMVVHCSWLPTADPLIAKAMGVRTRGKLRLTNEPVDVNQLKQWAIEIRQLGRRISDFMERNGIRPEDGY